MAPPSSFTGSQSLRAPAFRPLRLLPRMITGRAHKLLPPVAQQDVVVGPLADEGLVVVEVLAGRPQAQVRVVVLARPGQLRESSA